MAPPNDLQAITRDALQFFKLIEAKYLIIVDDDVRQSLAESIASLVLAVAEHARELQKP